VRRPPWRYRAFIDTHASIRDDQVDVNFKFCSQPEARLTCAEGRVEREITRSKFVVTGAALRTSKVLAKRDRLTLLIWVLCAHDLDFCHAFRQLQRCLKAVR